MDDAISKRFDGGEALAEHSRYLTGTDSNFRLRDLAQGNWAFHLYGVSVLGLYGPNAHSRCLETPHREAECVAHHKRGWHCVFIYFLPLNVSSKLCYNEKWRKFEGIHWNHRKRSYLTVRALSVSDFYLKNRIEICDVFKRTCFAKFFAARRPLSGTFSLISLQYRLPFWMFLCSVLLWTYK